MYLVPFIYENYQQQLYTVKLDIKHRLLEKQNPTILGHNRPKASHVLFAITYIKSN